MKIKKDSGMYIAGDFNIDFIYDSKEKRAILNNLEAAGFVQLIKEGTRQGSKSNTCIDNIFVNGGKENWKAEVKEKGISDHKLQVAEWRRKKTSKKRIKVQKRLMNSQNLWILKQLMAKEDWNERYQERGVNDAWNYFIETFKYNMDRACPKKEVIMEEKRKKIKWNREIEELKERIIWQKEKVRRNLGRVNETKNTLKRNRIRLRQLYNKSVKEHYREMMEKVGTDQKAIWKVINAATGKECGLRKEENNIKLKKNGEVCDDPNEVAEIFNEHYISVPRNISKKLSKIEPRSTV